jgi:hypothetical protein
MIGSRSEVDEKISSISQPFQTLLICLQNHLYSPSKQWAERIDGLHGDIESALRDILGTDAPARARLLDEPLSGRDLTDTIQVIKETQIEVAALATRWLRTPTEAVMEKLNAARKREAELFEIVLAGKNPVGLKVLPASGPSRRVRGRYKVANR